MFVYVGLVLVVLQAFAVSHGNEEFCPSLDCPVQVPVECALKQYVVGSDGQTRCPWCDKNVCDPATACQKFQNLTCPEIPPFCGKSQFVIGADNITRCRVCDKNMCEDWMATCPQIFCPDDDIPDGCRVPQFVIGGDGITMCRLCDKNRCPVPLV